MLGFKSDIKLISYILNIYIHHLSVYLILIALLFLMPQRLLLAQCGPLARQLVRSAPEANSVISGQ